MTTTTKLTKVRRDVLTAYGEQTIRASIDRTREANLLRALIDGASAAIRAKYQETDMAILRKYDLDSNDRCLRFQFPSGRVDGFNFSGRSDGLADVPYHRGCYSQDVFPVSEAFERAYDEHAQVTQQNDKAEGEKMAQFHAFLAACRSVEEVEAVIPLPADVRQRLGHGSSALVAVTAEAVATLKATFGQAA